MKLFQSANNRKGCRKAAGGRRKAAGLFNEYHVAPLPRGHNWGPHERSSWKPTLYSYKCTICNQIIEKEYPFGLTDHRKRNSIYCFWSVRKITHISPFCVQAKFQYPENCLAVTMNEALE